MRKCFKVAMAVAVAAVAGASLVSCGEEGGSASKSKIFGTIPSLHAKRDAKFEGIREKLKACTNEDEGMKLVAEYENLKKEYLAKIEEAAKALDGTELEIDPVPEFNIITPITITFRNFFSEIDMAPRFDIAGEVVVANDFEKPEGAKYLGSLVYLVGVDADGNQVFGSQIGTVHVEGEIGGPQVIKAGTPVEFDGITCSDGIDYSQTASMHLEFDYE